MYTTVIIEDDYLSSTYINRLLCSIPNIKVANSFKDGFEALKYLENDNENIDFIILDIKLKGILGTEIAKKLENKYPIIFTTSSENFAVEAFELGVIDYILKPVNIDRITTAIDKVKIFLDAKRKNNYSTIELSKENPHITIWAEKKHYNLPIHNIIYIESLKEYIRYTNTNNKLMCLGSLKDAIFKLSQYKFLQIHKSYVVNLNHITAYNKSSITLTNNYTLPIGKVYSQNFIEKKIIF